jgi:hypothetical protein
MIVHQKKCNGATELSNQLVPVERLLIGLEKTWKRDLEKDLEKGSG